MNRQTPTQAEAPRVSEAQTAEQAFQALQAELPKPPKTAEGQIGQRKYPYSTIADVWDVVRPLIAKHGFSIRQTEEPCDNDFVMLVTKMVFKDGDLYALSERPIASFEQACRDPQAYGSAMTYARRYSIISMLGLTPDDDDGAAGKRPQEPKGEVAPKGPRGGVDKKPPAEDELKLYGYPTPNGNETLKYQRNASDVARWVDDMEYVLQHNPSAWDANTNMLDIVLVGVEAMEKKGNPKGHELRQRLADMESLAGDGQFLRAG